MKYQNQINRFGYEDQTAACRVPTTLVNFVNNDATAREFNGHHDRQAGKGAV